MPPKTKIFVGKLPNECSEPALQKLFERHGEVTECSVLGNFGFVHMKTEDQALEAIRALNNYMFQGSSISVEQSTGEKRDGGGFRGGYRGGFRGGRGGGPMRGGLGGMRPSPYDRPPMGGRYGGPPPPPMQDRYGPLPPPPISRNGYYDEYERRESALRRPLPPSALSMERRPLPPPLPRDPYLRDPYDRYDAYDRLPLPARRSPPPMLDRRIPPPPPMGYDRRPDPYADLYRERDPYAARDIYGGRRSLSPRRYAGPRDMPPPRRF